MVCLIYSYAYKHIATYQTASNVKTFLPLSQVYHLFKFTNKFKWIMLNSSTSAAAYWVINGKHKKST